MSSRRLSITAPLILSAALVALALLALPAAASDYFDDVEGASYGPAVDALVDVGVLAGCESRAFCPDEELTRGQMATILSNALALPAADDFAISDGTFTEVVFRDVAGTTHEQAIYRLAAAGLTNGCDEGLFCPNDVVLRGQLATLLVRGFDVEETDEPFFDDISGVHADAIDRLASVGIAAGCSDSLTDFCPHDPVLRWQAVLFLGRSMDLLEPVELAPLDERRALQAEIDAEQARLEEERKAARERAAAEEAARNRIWDALAECESNGNWQINTGNGYYGGLQFHINTWRSVGGSGYPHEHSREEQIYRAELLLKTQGWGAWPHCSRVIGMR